MIQVVLVVYGVQNMIKWIEYDGRRKSVNFFIDPYFHLEDNGFASRKEATLAAIDDALEYLTKNKK